MVQKGRIRHEKKSAARVDQKSKWLEGRQCTPSPQERTAVELQRLERIGHGWRIENWGWRKVSEKMYKNRQRLT